MKSALLFICAMVSLAEHRPVVPLGLDLYMPVPETNRLTPEKVGLGRKLFFDRRLSRDQSVSCASCHDPERAFADAKPVAAGVFGRKGSRRVPTLINRGYGKFFFWDGRTSTLEEQVLQPIQNPKEMDMALADAVARLQPELKITAQEMSAALASYVRTILSGDSPYDRYVAGESDALSQEASQGLRIFRGKGNCSVCHLGPNLTDEGFHNTGVGRGEDAGRFLITGQEHDRGAFKTPTLREAALRPPYMHDGSLATLEDVIEFYDKGGNPNPNLDPEIRPLRLTAEEKRALAAFLRSLSGTILEGKLRQ